MGKRELATLGGGCFWCLEAVYTRLDGVLSVESGYMGGRVEDPSYEQVCTGETGHAEVVQITFDPEVVTYGDILDVFFAIHDPTTRDRQGNDVGPQYRSVIFYHPEEQQAASEAAIRALEALGGQGGSVVTEVQPAHTFYRAEDYHQDYFRNNPRQPYCAFVVAPKVNKFRRKFTSRVKQGA